MLGDTIYEKGNTKRTYEFFHCNGKNNLSYRKEPLTEEEICNLIVVYNSAIQQYYIHNKLCKLKPEEKIVTPFEIFSNISKDVNVIEREDDDVIM